MREFLEQLQVQFNQVVARLEGLDTPTEDGAQTPVGAQTNLMAENLSLLQGEVGQIGRYQRELDVRGISKRIHLLEGMRRSWHDYLLWSEMLRSYASTRKRSRSYGSMRRQLRGICLLCQGVG